MKLKVKKLSPGAVIPSYAKPGDAAVDLTCLYADHKGHNQVVYGTGLAFEIPDGHVGLIFPRSSICKVGQSLSNSVAVIDSQYRGEVKFVFNKHNNGLPTYEMGDRIGQLMVIPYPKMEFEEVTELSETERGTGGFGSSGR